MATELATRRGLLGVGFRAAHEQVSALIEAARDAEGDRRIGEAGEDDRAEHGADLARGVHAAGDQPGVRARDVLAATMRSEIERATNAARIAIATDVATNPKL